MIYQKNSESGYLVERLPEDFDLTELEAAANRVRAAAIESPLLESEYLNRRFGGRLLIKAESLQPTGSFKVRGAWNLMSQLQAADYSAGVVAISSGNHGQAVAWVAQRLGISRVVILMPGNSPQRKIRKTRQWGAEVIHFDRSSVDRAALIEHWQTEQGLTYIPAFDDRRVIAGAASAAYETIHECARRAIPISDFLVACSGGGLAAGSALAYAALSPNTKVWGVEPVTLNDTERSLALGKRVSNEGGAASICDALSSPEPGALTFSINKALLAGVTTVTDENALLAMRIAYEEFGLVVEPGGAIALAATITPNSKLSGNNVVAVLSGSNVDPGLFARAIDANNSHGQPLTAA